MAEKIDEKELVSFKELLMSNTIEVDAVTQLLMNKGVFVNRGQVLTFDKYMSILHR